MDTGAWWATVHGTTESDMTEGLILLILQLVNYVNCFFFLLRQDSLWDVGS